MNLYHYDAHSGVLLGQDVAQHDVAATEHFGEEKFLVPAHATLLSPPEAPYGHVAVFDGSEWSVTEDHRGETAYDAEGVERKIDATGPLPEDWSLQRPQPPPLHQERARVLAAIDARAGAERRRYISDLPGQVQIYMIKEKEAQALLDDPDAAAPQLRAEAAATGLALNDIRDRVLANAAVWRALSINIEARRLGLKAEAAAAADHAALAVVESVIDMGWTTATLGAHDGPPV